MKLKSNRSFRVVTALAQFLAISSIAYAANAPGVTNTEVVIGAHTSESGPIGSTVSGFARAMSAVFDRENEKGGVNGRKIKFIRVDGQSEPAKAAMGTRKLVDEHNIFAMVGGMGPSHQAAYKYLMEKGVPDLFFSDYLKVYGTPLKQGVISGGFSYESEGMAYGEYAVKNMPGKKACFLITDNAFGEEVMEGFKAAVKGKPITIGPVERVDRLAAQANSQVLSMKKAGCDIVVTTTAGGLCPNAITYGASQEFKPKWFVSMFNINPKFVSLLPESMREGVISGTVSPLDETFGASGYSDYKALMAKAGIPLGRPASMGYGTAEFFVEALKRAGKDLTRESIVKASESLTGWKCSMCTMPLGVSATSHFAFPSPELVITEKGVWKKM